MMRKDWRGRGWKGWIRYKRPKICGGNHFVQSAKRTVINDISNNNIKNIKTTSTTTANYDCEVKIR